MEILFASFLQKLLFVSSEPKCPILLTEPNRRCNYSLNLIEVISQTIGFDNLTQPNSHKNFEQLNTLNCFIV